MRNLTAADFAVLWPHASASIVSGIVSAQQAVYPRFGITTAMRVLMMWAQISHECNAWQEPVESLDYSTEALRSQWPNHFTAEQALEYGRTGRHPANQVAIGNLAYGGRMGNAYSVVTDSGGDGYRFRGRGLIQTTGREGYMALAKETGIDVVAHPDLVVDPQHALLCGVAEFANYPGILSACDAGDVVRVTRLINGGEIGLPERKAWYARWKTQLGVS